MPSQPPRRRLTVAADEPGSLDRHPDDGFELAEPYPIGPLTEVALRAVIRAVLPPPPAPRTEGMEDLIAEHVRVMVQYMPPLTAFGFFVLMHLLDWSPLWRFAAREPLTALPPEEGSKVLAGIARSRFLPLRMMMVAPKALILSTYFDQDAVHRRLDYDVVTFTRERIDLRRRLCAGGAARDDDHIHVAEVP